MEKKKIKCIVCKKIFEIPIVEIPWIKAEFICHQCDEEIEEGWDEFALLKLRKKKGDRWIKKFLTK